ncbi:MAG: DMT family protein [Lentisphaeria bacterium]|nr:DMT family protein [Lentisphaeria bacterium]
MNAVLNFFNSIPVTARVVALLCCSNLFMLFAWYGHLKNLKEKPFIIALLVSWGIAFFEYTLMIPANRLGATQFSLAQLKIMQEVITLAVFVPFALFYMKEKFSWDFVWAGLCLCGAVYFMFRKAIF